MSENARPTVMVAIPAFNEAKYLGSVVLEAFQYAAYVVVVDDGSSDRTAAIARLAGASVIVHERNQGYGRAIQTILRHARSKSPDLLVIMDGDGQHDASEIPRFVKAYQEGYEVVLGSRQIDSARIPRLRRAGQSVISWFARILSRTSVPDSQCGFRGFSRKAVLALEPREDGMAISTEIISETVRMGLKIGEVPVSAIYTEDGSTLNPVRHGVDVLGRTLNMISERRPLLFFGVGGSVACLLGILAGIRVLDSLARSGQFAIGTALLCALFLIVGVFAIFTGIVLNILTRTNSRSSGK
jgi:glycosyltransferase involved in cell wall biosynthesis